MGWDSYRHLRTPGEKDIKWTLASRESSRDWGTVCLQPSAVPTQDPVRLQGYASEQPVGTQPVMTTQEHWCSYKAACR